jgi:hypothetical protein
MSVNNFQIKRTELTNKQINIPINFDWDYLGVDDSIDEYETDIVKKVIGKGYDFEVDRFSHEQYENNKTEINYEFYFHSGGTLNDINNWVNNYIGEGFTTQEVYYYENNFTNSFFKLDLYDSTDEKQQTNYLTIILPTQQGEKMNAIMQRTPVFINKPKFVLDFVGDREGFFIYWLKSKDFLNIDKFYMTAKFYDAKRGGFVKMMTGSNDNLDTTNGPQSKLGNKYVFDSSEYFYYVVNLNYDKQTYVITNTKGQRVGSDIPIKWFEYVNP